MPLHEAWPERPWRGGVGWPAAGAERELYAHVRDRRDRPLFEPCHPSEPESESDLWPPLPVRGEHSRPESQQPPRSSSHGGRSAWRGEPISLVDGGSHCIRPDRLCSNIPDDL